MARVLKPSHCDDRGRVARNRGWNSDQLVAPRKKKKNQRKGKKCETKRRGDRVERQRMERKTSGGKIEEGGSCSAHLDGPSVVRPKGEQQRRCRHRSAGANVPNAKAKGKKNERWEKIAASGENNESVRPSRPASSVRRGLWFQYDFRMLLCKDDVIQFGSELNMWNFQMR